LPDGSWLEGMSNTAWGRPVILHRLRTNPRDSDKSVADTLAIMRHQARVHAGDPAVVSATWQACSRLRPGASQRDIACALFHWIRGTVHFVEDEVLLHYAMGETIDKELLIVPPVLLSMPVPMGDCDDFSLLTASMALAAGLRPYYVTIAVDPEEDPRKFSHIYTCVRLDDENGFLVLDAGNRLSSIPPGWEASKGVTRKAIWAI
jgi:transglutaminase-like putative cysteine protease